MGLVRVGSLVRIPRARLFLFVVTRQIQTGRMTPPAVGLTVAPLCGLLKSAPRSVVVSAVWLAVLDPIVLVSVWLVLQLRIVHLDGRRLIPVPNVLMNRPPVLPLTAGIQRSVATMFLVVGFLVVRQSREARKFVLQSGSVLPTLKSLHRPMNETVLLFVQKVQIVRVLSDPVPVRQGLKLRAPRKGANLRFMTLLFVLAKVLVKVPTTRRLVVQLGVMAKIPATFRLIRHPFTGWPIRRPENDTWAT